MISLVLATLIQETQMLPTGKMISPIGNHAEVGSYPINMVKTIDGKYAVVTTMGYRQGLSVIDLSTGKLASQFDINLSSKSKKSTSKDGLYFGLAVHPKSGLIYASQGAQDIVSTYKVDEFGQISVTEQKFSATKDANRNGLPFHFAGLATNSNGSRLLVVNNQTNVATKGSVTLYSTDTQTPIANIPTSGFPLDVAYKTVGKGADEKAYVLSERDGLVDVVNLNTKKVEKQIRTGESPTNLLLTRNQHFLYVSNNASDTVSQIDTTTDKVVGTIPVRPAELRGLPGAGPLGLTLSEDEKQLFVTLADMQCVSVIDTKSKSVRGYIPTGWLPTAVLHHSGNLFVSSAKGIQAMNPNAKSVKGNGTYIQNIIEGNVSKFPVPGTKDLQSLTAKVISNNRITKGLNSSKIASFTNPGIKHVIYIVKENRTYDNVLGDLPQGNGDPTLTLFPRKVTPNQHAIAERFVLLDNFYVCAEVSQDGWQWSTSGMPSAYGSRNTPYNYSGRGRSYDTEGSNNGEAVELMGIRNVAKPAAGYIWEHCANNKVTYRNYGMFGAFVGIDDKRLSANPNAKDSFPLVKSLIGHTNTNFRHYDLSYADSPAYDEFGVDIKSRLKTYGEFKTTNRFSEWKREFDCFVKDGKMPQFQSIRFGNDHTSGTKAGIPTPSSMVADNDYAVGLLVEAVSNSPFWKDTLICVLEDDAQAGIDHVDAHRSTAYVISPYIRKSTVDSTFYNTDSMLRTIQLVLGMPPMSQYDAVATPFQFLSKNASNSEPFKAIKPNKDIITALNSKTAYRSKDSNGIPRFAEESEIDEELNDILWKSIKGINTPTPQPKYGVQSGRKKRD